MKRKAGFSLIELLVVIAIIAILAAILFPIFVGAKERGNLAGCASNLRQLGSAFRMYIDDYNGRYPAASRLAYGQPKLHAEQMDNVVTWDVAIFKYVKNINMYRCPSDKFKRPPIAGSPCKSPRSYSINDQYNWHYYRYGGQAEADIRNAGTWTESEMRTPASRYILLSEWPRYVEPGTGNIYYNYFGSNLYHTLSDNRSQEDGQHMAASTTNYLFFDGHVVAAAPKKMNDYKYWAYLPGVGADLEK